MHVLPASLEHVGRIVHSDYAALRLIDADCHGLRGGAYRTAEIVADTVGPGVFSGEYADQRDQTVISGYRAPDHVGKNTSHFAVKSKIRHFLKGSGVNLVSSVVCHGRNWLFLCFRTVILANCR